MGHMWLDTLTFSTQTLLKAAESQKFIVWVDIQSADTRVSQYSLSFLLNLQKAP